MKKVISAAFVILLLATQAGKIDGALTPAQFDNLQNYKTKAVLLRLKCQALVGFLEEVLRRGDPASALNQNITAVQLQALFDPPYATLKTEIQAALNDLP